MGHMQKYHTLPDYEDFDIWSYLIKNWKNQSGKRFSCYSLGNAYNRRYMFWDYICHFLHIIVATLNCKAFPKNNEEECYLQRLRYCGSLIELWWYWLIWRYLLKSVKINLVKGFPVTIWPIPTAEGTCYMGLPLLLFAHNLCISCSHIEN